jgi:predicted nucleic acid-binding protein
MSYRSKAEWAAAKAQEIHQQARELAAERVPSAKWRRVRAKLDGAARLREEAFRFERMARRYREQGV